MADDQPHIVVMNAMKSAPLKLSFLVHFIFTTWGIQGYWSPDSYFFYNLLFFFTLFWSIHSKSSADAPLLCLVINVTSILLDVIVLGVYYPRPSFGGSDRFSFGMAILNLVLRPVSSIAIHQVWRSRSTEGEESQAQRPDQARGYEGIEGQSYGTTPSF